MNREIEIAGRKIGVGHPVYIVAEMSANHNGDIEEAFKIIRSAKECGADAVKLQTYTPDTLTIDCDNAHFLIGKGTPWEGRKLYDLYGEAFTPWDWQPRLKSLADEIGITLFSTPFDETAVDFLEDLDVPAHKIASFELGHLPLLKKVAKTGKPVILSTGMSTEDEIDEAVRTLVGAGARDIVLLKCTSAYPASPEDMNLKTIPRLAERFGVLAGLSDHTMGPVAPVAAVALGACLIEKHFTLSREVPGPDSSFSMTPPELRELVELVRRTEKTLGACRFGPSAGENASMVFRRSLFVVEDVAKGESFTSKNVRTIRPGYGLHTRHLDEIVGKRASRDIPRGTPLDWKLVEDADEILKRETHA